MGMHIFRNVGPDAMKDVRDGKAKLTDPKYVEGAQALADLASSGSLGEGFSTRDADTSTNLFLTGKAAMTYDGSWLLSSINDPKKNTIGDTNIGFMAFPAVDGGAGSIDQFAANAGAVMAMSPKQFGPKVGEWLKCISENYGAQALKDSGTISGFKVNEDVKELPVMTSQIQEKITGLKDPVLWFEALLDPKSNSLASTNVSLLTTGQMSAQDYMSALQKSVDAAR
jgi:raffinose/stachyose/melibiose transport system substrate-binding protein